ncbi:4-hydroxybenzoate octaprenyltransferase [Trichlorobacter lovleyi]|jgi:putative 4-hydroxybenzoate polyprenyltransferase|uniref:4-hydroxybenzoate polyprenyltransferase n=1 Tax=Trichlorobacter lovleyi (strain ATCC BAA-1151 / DSM 17278 / SZ) TaxID=398767 RepID=B3E1N3_TRIL1|nr:4-hydroxybenzoate octaprenyltransferase [Trichlorobacter lovleyi]ACD94125.1 4-hydroxybenzoate polyprenyltransferase [Trichlorobacter lovleyi SZ]
MTAVLQKITIFMEMIKFSHTIFALPFALSGALLAIRGLPGARQLLFIILAMVGARTAAMAMNRLIDADIDAKNPRTASRAIPAGLLSKGAVFGAIVLSVALLLWSAAMLNPLCLKLSPIALGFLVLYSYCKRFTALAHIVLGICLAAAPIGAWVALTGKIELPAIVLGLIVLFWVSAFDMLYALQDLEYDRSVGLHSIPVALGVNGSLWLSRLFHLITVGLLVWLIVLLGLGPWFWAGSAVMAAMLLYEHWLLRGGDLTKLDAAFFTMNGYISLTFLAATAADVFLGR